MREERWAMMDKGHWREMRREVGRQREGNRIRERQTTMKRGRAGALGRCWGN